MAYQKNPPQYGPLTPQVPTSPRPSHLPVQGMIPVDRRNEVHFSLFLYVKKHMNFCITFIIISSYVLCVYFMYFLYRDMLT